MPSLNATGCVKVTVKPNNQSFVQATEFSTTKPLLFGEFVCKSLYLPKELITEMTILEIHSNEAKIVHSEKICLPTGTAHEHTVKLAKPILIRSSGMKYKIQCDPSPRHRIMKFASEVKLKSNICVEFMNKSGPIGVLKFNKRPNSSVSSDNNANAMEE